MQQQTLSQMLCQLPCFKKLKVTDINEINTGLSQPCFRVEYKNNFYFAKYVSPNSTEALASQIAANHNISPHLVYVGNNWLITEFIVGEGLDTVIQSEVAKIATMLTLLSRCHRIDYALQYNALEPLDNLQTTNQLNLESVDQKTTKIQMPTLDISNTISELFENITCNDVLLNNLMSLSKVLQQNLTNVNITLGSIEQVLCHGDANFSNAMQLKYPQLNSVAVHKLIDFECACIAPVDFDLAMLMAVNEIERAKIALINDQYISINQAHLAANNIADIVDNSLVNKQYMAIPSILLVTCYYDLSILINCLWYLSKYKDTSQVNYKILAKKQIMLLPMCHPQVNNILDEMR